jgi:type III secretory pathway component EscS
MPTVNAVPSVKELPVKPFDTTLLLDLFLILTPVIVVPIIGVCIAIAWFSPH